jgi:small subunit ribosomal protein S8
MKDSRKSEAKSLGAKGVISNQVVQPRSDELWEGSKEAELVITLKYLGREKRPCITNLKRVSKPGLRNYTTYKEIPKILGGMGIVILSTSQGLMTGREARFQRIGGEILCAIW